MCHSLDARTPVLILNLVLRLIYIYIIWRSICTYIYVYIRFLFTFSCMLWLARCKLGYMFGYFFGISHHGPCMDDCIIRGLSIPLQVWTAATNVFKIGYRQNPNLQHQQNDGKKSIRLRTNQDKVNITCVLDSVDLFCFQAVFLDSGRLIASPSL